MEFSVNELETNIQRRNTRYFHLYRKIRRQLKNRRDLQKFYDFLEKIPVDELLLTTGIIEDNTKTKFCLVEMIEITKTKFCLDRIIEITKKFLEYVNNLYGTNNNRYVPPLTEPEPLNYTISYIEQKNIYYFIHEIDDFVRNLQGVIFNEINRFFEIFEIKTTHRNNLLNNIRTLDNATELELFLKFLTDITQKYTRAEEYFSGKDLLNEEIIKIINKLIPETINFKNKTCDYKTGIKEKDMNEYISKIENTVENLVEYYFLGTHPFNLYEDIQNYFRTSM